MSWTESITHDDFIATPEMTSRDVQVFGFVVSRAMRPIGQVLPISRIAHKIQSGIARPEGQTR
jgi:hypothetical protein